MSAVPDVDHAVGVSAYRVSATATKAPGSSTEAVCARTLLSRLAQWASMWQQKRESRKALLNLTDAELLDIGVTPAEARKEAAKSFFWD